MFISIVVLLLPFPRWLTELGDRGLWVVLGPISKGSRQFSQRAGDNLSSSTVESVPAAEHRQALIEIYNLKLQQQQDQALISQLSGLDEQFGQAPVRLIPVKVSGSDSSSWREILHLNHHGLQPGQIVLGRLGLTTENSTAENTNENIFQMCVVGQIRDDGSATFRLQLLTDADFSLPVFIEPRWDRPESWRAHGQLKGRGMGEIEVVLVKANYSVQAGDAVVACSDTKKLPVELLVGFVKNCRLDPDNPVFHRITVEPAVDLTRLREVIVVGTQWGSIKN